MEDHENDSSFLTEDEILNTTINFLKSYARNHHIEISNSDSNILKDLLFNNTELVSTRTINIKSSFFEEEKPDISYLIELEEEGKKGVSICIINIRYKFKEAVIALAQLAAGVLTPIPPWAYLLSVLLGVYHYDSLTKITLEDSEASVLYLMWLRCDEYGRISRDGLYELVNEDRSRHHRSILSFADFNDAILLLKNIHLIELDEETDMWCLLDEVKIRRRQ